MTPDPAIAQQRRTLLTGALFAFPIVLVISDLLMAGVADQDGATFVDNLAGARGRWMAGAVVSLLAVLLFAAAAQVISERLAPAAPRWAWYGKLVLWAGLFFGFAINALALIDWVAADPELNRSAMVAFEDTVIESPIQSIIYGPGLLTPLALLALGIGFIRTGVAGRAVGILLAVAAVAFPVAQIADILPASVAFAGLFLAAAVLLTRSAPVGAPAGEPVPAAGTSPAMAR